jgi:hypothetical protein
MIGSLRPRQSISLVLRKHRIVACTNRFFETEGYLLLPSRTSTHSGATRPHLEPIKSIVRYRCLKSHLVVDASAEHLHGDCLLTSQRFRKVVDLHCMIVLMDESSA